MGAALFTSKCDYPDCPQRYGMAHSHCAGRNDLQRLAVRPEDPANPPKDGVRKQAEGRQLKKAGNAQFQTVCKRP